MMNPWPRTLGNSISALAAALLVATLGCSDKPAPSTSAAQRPTAPPPTSKSVDEEVPLVGIEDLVITDSEEEASPPEYVYSPIGKRDPFRSPFQDLLSMERRVSEDRLTPLQRWDLDQLALNAIVSATADPVAMVIDPEGHGHLVRRNMLIGRNWGRVTAIRRECLVVTEQMRDATGAPMTVQQERCLPKDESELRFQEQLRRQMQ